jgi:hypothetical protein
MQMSKDAISTVKSVLLGAAGGAIVLAIVGFNWGGWVTGGTAEKYAMQRAEAAVVLALSPICVDNFRRQPDALAQLASLQKLSSYDQRGFVEKGGWATAMGAKNPNSGVARACADSLSQMKVGDLG